MTGAPGIDPALLARRRAQHDARRARQAKVIELHELEPRELLRRAKDEASGIVTGAPSAAAESSTSAPTPDARVARALLGDGTRATALGTLYTKLEQRLLLDTAKVCRHLSRLGTCVGDGGTRTQRPATLLHCARERCAGQSRFAFDAADEIAREEFAKGVRLAADDAARPPWKVYQQDVRARRNRRRREQAEPPTAPIDSIQAGHLAPDGARWRAISREIAAEGSALRGLERAEVVRLIQHVYEDASDNSACGPDDDPIDVPRLARRWGEDPDRAADLAREAVRVVRRSDEAEGVRTRFGESFDACWRLSRMDVAEMFGLTERLMDAVERGDPSAGTTELAQTSDLDERYVAAVRAVAAWIRATEGTALGSREAMQLADDPEMLRRAREWDVATHGGRGAYDVDVEHVVRRAW